MLFAISEFFRRSVLDATFRIQESLLTQNTDFEKVAKTRSYFIASKMKDISELLKSQFLGNGNTIKDIDSFENVVYILVECDKTKISQWFCIGHLYDPQNVSFLENDEDEFVFPTIRVNEYFLGSIDDLENRFFAVENLRIDRDGDFSNPRFDLLKKAEKSRLFIQLQDSINHMYQELEESDYLILKNHDRLEE